MLEILYVTLLISAISIGIINLVATIIGRRPTKLWRYIMCGLAGVCVIAMIGLVITTLIL